MAGGDHFQAEADSPRRAPWHAPILQVLAFRETATGAVVTTESAQSSGQAATPPTTPTPPTIVAPPVPPKQANLCDGITMPGLTAPSLGSPFGPIGHTKPGRNTESHMAGCTPPPAMST
jgi:hypothetical protein